MPTLTCSPANLIATQSSLQSLAPNQLLAIIVYCMRLTSGLTAAQLRANSVAYASLSKHEKLVALTAMIMNQLQPSLSLNTIINATPCSSQCGSETLLQGEALYLFCNYFQNVAV